MYKQGHNGAPPPIDIPIKLLASFTRVTEPEVTVIPLKKYATAKILPATSNNKFFAKL